jgi:hypothetical protein
MRYNIGQKVPFVAFYFTYQNGGKSDIGHAFYHPLFDRDLTIEMKYLECIEHHKVPEAWDETKKLECDGFIFVDEDGNRYLNQYPIASYGQINDEEDGIVQLSSETELKLYKDAKRVLSNIYRGIQDKQCSPELKKALEDHRDELIDLIEKETDKLVSIQPILLRFKDGSYDSHENICETVLFDKGEIP